MAIVVVFLWVSNKVEQILGLIFQANIKLVIKSKALYARSLISVYLLGCQAESMVLCICLIFPGLKLVSQLFVRIKKAMKLKQLFWQSILSVNVFRWVSNNCQVIQLNRICKA